ncbi:MAG: helix-turn-helix domain-containing protein [Acidimicrobiia bacterium]|nr:helix-turn-helix domain-containing protein [Acidimicrobiia bacterium]
MVVDKTRAVDLDDEEVDRLFHALADRTRRDILAQAMTGDHSVSALARRYPFSFAAVQKHVAVLEKAGLVTKRRHGREQRVVTNMNAIERARTLLDHFERLWVERLERFEAVLAEDDGGPDA